MLVQLLLTHALLGSPCSQTPADLPFEALGGALLEAGGAQGDPGADPETRFLRRLEPLHEHIDLGGLELWLPLRVVQPDATLTRAKRPREWRLLAQVALDVQRRWCAELGLFEGDQGAEIATALDHLEAWVRRSPVTVRLPPPDKLRQRSGLVRAALLGDARGRGLPVLLAPGRAQYLSLIGAAGLQAPNLQSELWTERARRSPSKALSHTMVVLALVFGPTQDGGPPFEEQRVEDQTHQMYAAHAFSHQLSNALLPTAPRWFTEGMAILDTVRVVGVDETLCAGYAGRQPTLFDGWQSLPEAFFVFTRIERSPFRTGGSSDLFVDELRTARAPGGYAILDLDRSHVGLITPGPFLGDEARLPDEAVIGPHGLKEGFAEFFRAYCGAFAGWLAEREADGSALLDRVLRELHERGRRWDGSPTHDLAEVLFELTSQALGGSLDAERDLEGQFQAWLQERR